MWNAAEAFFWTLSDAASTWTFRQSIDGIRTLWAFTVSNPDYPMRMRSRPSGYCQFASSSLGSEIYPKHPWPSVPWGWRTSSTVALRVMRRDYFEPGRFPTERGCPRERIGVQLKG